MPFEIDYRTFLFVNYMNGGALISGDQPLIFTVICKKYTTVCERQLCNY